MTFEIRDNDRQAVEKLKPHYAGKYPFLILVNVNYRRKGYEPEVLPGLTLALDFAREGECVIVYGLPVEVPAERLSLVDQLRQMPNVRFVDSPFDEEAIRQADNELRAPWLPHNVKGRHSDTPEPSPKTRD